MSRGRRCDDTPKLNVKKVIATIVAIIVVIMFCFSIKRLLISSPLTKDVSTIETYFSVYTNDKWGVINNNGEMIVDCIYDEMVAVPDENTDVFICTTNTNYENEQFNTKVINKSGDVILNDYNNVQAIENSDGINVWFENNILKFEQNGKYGLTDLTGKLILNAEYDKIYALDGVQKNIIIEQNGLKGLVNTSMGEVIIKPEYNEITLLTDSYENGYIVSKDGKFGIISADSKIIFEPIYDKIENVASNSYYVVTKDGAMSVIDSLGTQKINSGFDTVKEINGDNIIITLNGLYGVINIDGTSIINPEYEELKYIYGTYYIAKKDGNYGIISSIGDIKIDFTYKTMSYIKTADFIEADNENYKTDLIDREFNVVLSNVIVSDLNLDDGYIRIREGDEYNYYNFKFEKKTTQEALATNTLFLVKEFGKYGYENKNGDRIVDCIYDDAKEQNKFGYCAVKKDGVWGVLKSDGTVILEPTENLDDYLYIDFIEKWHLDKNLNMNVYTK